MSKSIAQQLLSANRALACFKQEKYREDQWIKGRKRISVWIEKGDEDKVRHFVKMLNDAVSANPQRTEL